MKNLILLLTAFLLLQAYTFAQQIITERSHEPVFFKVTSHESNIKELPEKSFYESKSDWQYIIDTTWGPGLPLAQKEQIFDAYVSTLENNFDGFESLGFTQATWNTLCNNYNAKINDTTSRGRFSAIMYYFAMNLRDGHTYAFDEGVAHTPLNPGIPVLILGSLYQNEHFGAALTVLEDSTALVLRADNDHPLNLEPGDIILGYEGVLWKDLVQELMEAELPAFGGREYHGGTTGSSSSYDNGLHICVGMNWHLFNTIDILKYSTGEIVHLSVAPLLNLNLPPMINNEQLEIPSIPFPNYWSGELVTYGILPNSNIGYMYVIAESPTALAEQQFFEAIAALHNTDGLVIDMRFNAGGWALWHDAFAILSNEVTYSIDDALRCSPSNWLLCPENDTVTYRIAGSPTDQYERPIAVLLGPACFSMGDVNAYRLRYLSTVKTFGRPTAANLGWNDYVTNFPHWSIRYSMGDMYHLNQPGNYLNRVEFPIDYPIWFNKDDVANGYDTIVEEALEWMNNLAYGHDVSTNKSYALPGNDTITVYATIENPNSSNINAQIFVKNLDDTLIDSLELSEIERGDIWQGEWLAVNQEDLFKLEIKTTDQTTGESFTIENVDRITTAGPIIIYDMDISYLPSTDIWQFKPHLKNEGQTLTIENMSSDDSTITSISGPLYLGSIAPGEIIIHQGNYSVKVDSNFSGVFSFNFDIMRDSWIYWKHSDTYFVTDVDQEISLPVSYKLDQNYPNPFNPTTTIKYDLPERSFATIIVYDVLGNNIAELINEEKQTGTYEITWYAENLPSGVYFYRLQAGSFVETKKMILLK
jgi:hypothetical protein